MFTSYRFLVMFEPVVQLKLLVFISTVFHTSHLDHEALLDYKHYKVPSKYLQFADTVNH